MRNFFRLCPLMFGAGPAFIAAAAALTLMPMPRSATEGGNQVAIALAAMFTVSASRAVL